MQIVIRGTVGLLDAVKAAETERERVETRFSRRFLEKWQQRVEMAAEPLTLPVGAVSLENGLFQALWLLGAAASSGLTVYRDLIPMDQVTLEICELLDRNPYLSPGRGYVLLRDGLPREGETVIGYLTPGKGRIVIEKEGQRFLTAPERGY